MVNTQIAPQGLTLRKSFRNEAVSVLNRHVAARFALKN